MFKKALAVLGGFTLLILLSVIGFFGYALYQGGKFDTSSKAYIEADIPPILSTWSKQEFLIRAAPVLIANFKEEQVDLDSFFLELSEIGRLERLTSIEGDSNSSYSPEGKVITAVYTVAAQFKRGTGRFQIRLQLMPDDQWKILEFHVNSLDLQTNT